MDIVQASGKNALIGKTATTLLAPLLKVLKDGVQKEPMRIDGLLALYALALLARSNQEIEEKLMEEKAWQDVVGAGSSVLLSTEIAAKQSEQDAALTANFCHLLLSQVFVFIFFLK